MPLDSSAFTIHDDVTCIKNFGFFYPQNTWDKWTKMSTPYPYISNTVDIYEPKKYAPTIRVAGTTLDSTVPSKEVRLENLFFINAYECIRVEKVQHIHFNNLKFNNIGIGIKVLRASAHITLHNIDMYPYWSRAYKYQGISMRNNLYNEVYAVGIQLGDIGSETIEQCTMTNINIIGCADGLILGGKGVQGTNIKVDNCFRPMTIKSYSSSSLHNLTNLWLSSFVSQQYYSANKSAITDGSVYNLKVESGGSVNISNVQCPIAQGVGIWVAKSDFSCNVENVYVDEAYHKGFVASFGTGIYRLGARDITIKCAVDTVIPFTFDNLINSDVSDLKIAGVTPTTKLAITGNLVTTRNRLDFTTLGMGTIQKNIQSGGFNARYVEGADELTSLDNYDATDIVDMDIIKATKRRNGANSAMFTTSVANTTSASNSGSIVKFKVRRYNSALMDAVLQLDNHNYALYSELDNVFSLGRASYRWKDIYSATGIINTSDRNLKTDIENTKLGLEFINQLKPVTYKFIDGQRPHQGLIAQDVKAVMDNLDIDFAGYIADKDSNGNEILGLRYTEFIAPLIKAVQELSAKVKELEQKLTSQ